MSIVGLIAEYNPFHNGHLYHIKKIKEKFSNSLLILVLNGYFLERGEVSILSKEDKTKLALFYGVDLVVELPFVFGTQSADIFAERAIEILANFHVTDLVFGSECNDIDYLLEQAKLQLNPQFSDKVKSFLKTGINYPTALSKAIGLSNPIKEPNDLLGISYAKAILKHHYSITLHTIKRTNNYHDIKSNSAIISASNIRNKLEQKKDISSFVPKKVLSFIQTVDYSLLWKLIQYKIVTENDLSIYLTVDEGIESRLKKMVLQATNLDDFILKIKTKRYTYNKIHRMLIHILLGITKNENDSLSLDYIHILGFNKNGQKFLKTISTNSSLPLRPIFSSKLYEFEKKAAVIYEFLTNAPAISFESSNRPCIFLENSSFDIDKSFSYNEHRKK